MIEKIKTALSAHIRYQFNMRKQFKTGNGIIVPTRKCFLTLFLGIFLSLTPIIIGYKAPMADVFIKGCQQDPINCSIKIKIEGLIGKNDYKDIVSALEYAKSIGFPEPVVEIYANSEGGDVEVAIRIGRLIRSYGASFANYPYNGSPLEIPSKCYSACVVIAAGAASRTFYGTYGIHRPYFADASSLEPRNFDANYKKMIKDLEIYFDEMNMPKTLIEAMTKVPPEEMKLFKGMSEKSSEFGLVFADPAFEEMSIAREAGIYGITSLEFRKRNQKVDKCTNYLINGGTINELNICQTMIRGNLTREQAVGFIELRDLCPARTKDAFTKCAKEKYNMVVRR